MVLVVIDCQPRYMPFGAYLDALAEEVKTARQAGIPIIFLEYSYAGQSTYEHILDLVLGYEDNFVRLQKSTFGGGNEVIEACRSKGWDMSEVSLTGAVTYCCVAATAEEILLHKPETIQHVIARACFDKYVGGEFPRHENIRWVRA